jgi:hypothetical protein
MLCWQLTGEAWRCESRERPGAFIRARPNRQLPELETLQLIENMERFLF